KAGGNRKKAEQGIIFIDEIDKLAEQSSDFDHYSNRDVSGRSVQEELLDLLESGGSRNVLFGNHLQQQMELDTSRILFIAAGAFNGLDRIVKENRRWKAGIGFVSAKTSSAFSENVGSSIGPADLESYGFIPELLGRFPVICSLASLSENNLASIMVEPKNSILGEYQKYFRSFGMEVEFKEGALKKIAQIAAERGTGARGLRSVLEAVLQPYLFAVGDSGSQAIEKQVTIDEKMVEF
ncbi:MAG: AAA family ATPase, partial [Syntrophales bacterium]|nr:AAA family ATPase [Syntrophales bacterium]